MTVCQTGGRAERVYDDDQIQIWRGDCAEVVQHLRTDGVQIDAVLTDCPYDARTHDNARTNKHDGPLIDFPPLDFDTLCAHLEAFATLAPRWLVFTCALSQAAQLVERYRNDPQLPDGLRHVRTGVFTKTNPMPQMSGDRPGTGFEMVAHLYARPGQMHWFGGGQSAVYHHARARGLHPTRKPEGLAHQWLKRFTRPGELVLDPYAGCGWMAQACQRLGRRCISIEIDEKYIPVILNGLKQPSLPLVAPPMSSVGAQVAMWGAS